MIRSLLIGSAAIAGLAGCTASIPYRDGVLTESSTCAKTYRGYDATLLADREPVKINPDDPCWRRSREEHEHYDLLFVEFDDQGWVQGALAQRKPADPDYLRELFREIEAIHRKLSLKNQGMSLAVFVHGWHHNADAIDHNVHSFRRLLREIATAESIREGREREMRVVGLYIGWRGESLTLPLLRDLTFWERKNTAERVAQGSVRELLEWLDVLRDSGRGADGRRNVRMLTIGHSFGGLVAFEATSGTFLRNATRFKGGRPDDRYMSRVGDLVVIVNPAFEGARYEPLRAAGLRLRGVENNQLPVVIVATSRADWATRVAFPLARTFNTLFESQPDEQWQARVRTVGHNRRYITHELGRCAPGDDACHATCRAPAVAGSAEDRSKDEARRAYEHMSGIAREGFTREKTDAPYRRYLCGGLDLRSTAQHYPVHNPFWVVRTTRDIMKDHGDIFNRNFINFIRQMYLGVIAARSQAKE